MDAMRKTRHAPAGGQSDPHMMTASKSRNIYAFRQWILQVYKGPPWPPCEHYHNSNEAPLDGSTQSVSIKYILYRQE
jgi:hypothetical protein